MDSHEQQVGIYLIVSPDPPTPVIMMSQSDWGASVTPDRETGKASSASLNTMTVHGDNDDDDDDDDDDEAATRSVASSREPVQRLTTLHSRTDPSYFHQGSQYWPVIVPEPITPPVRTVIAVEGRYTTIRQRERRALFVPRLCGPRQRSGTLARRRAKHGQRSHGHGADVFFAAPAEHERHLRLPVPVSAPLPRVLRQLDDPRSHLPEARARERRRIELEARCHSLEVSAIEQAAEIRSLRQRMQDLRAQGGELRALLADGGLGPGYPGLVRQIRDLRRQLHAERARSRAAWTEEHRAALVALGDAKELLERGSGWRRGAQLARFAFE